MLGGQIFLPEASVRTVELPMAHLEIIPGFRRQEWDCVCDRLNVAVVFCGMAACQGSAEIPSILVTKLISALPPNLMASASFLPVLTNAYASWWYGGLGLDSFCRSRAGVCMVVIPLLPPVPI